MQIVNAIYEFVLLVIAQLTPRYYANKPGANIDNIFKHK